MSLVGRLKNWGYLVSKKKENINENLREALNIEGPSFERKGNIYFMRHQRRKLGQINKATWKQVTIPYQRQLSKNQACPENNELLRQVINSHPWD